MDESFSLNKAVEPGCVRATNEFLRSNFQDSARQLEKLFLEPQWSK
jgi:hypothetical protein